MSFIRIVRAGTQDELAALARTSGWMELESGPWRFLDGYSRSWWTSGGSTVRWQEVTFWGTSVLQIDGGGDQEQLQAGLVDRFHLVDLATSAERAAAAEPIERVCGLLEVTSLLRAAAEDDPVDPVGMKALAQALDDPHPSVRLTALRSLGVLPTAIALALLEDRENDPANPGLAEWRRHFAAKLESAGDP